VCVCMCVCVLTYVSYVCAGVLPRMSSSGLSAGRTAPQFSGP
jgi:hypothetical protein